MSDNGNRVLYTEDVIAGYVPEVDILNGVSIAVHAGEIVTVVGPNGAGKSTTIRVLLGLLRADAGRGAAAGPRPVDGRRLAAPAARLRAR